MRRIVFSWELGNHSGHIAELRPVAQHMALHGHTCTLLLRDVRGLVQHPGDKFGVLQAPLWRAPTPGPRSSPLSYAEVLLRFGFHDPVFLQPMVAAWCQQLKQLNTEVLVANYAPTALVAARALALPALTLGTGFYTPPKLNPTPNLRPWMTVSAQQLAQADAQVTHTINQVLHSYGRPALTSLADLFDVQANLLTTVAELDHYPARKLQDQSGQYCGPIFEIDRGRPIAWSAGTESGTGIGPATGNGPRILAYLRPHMKNFEAVLRALQRTGARTVVIAPGIASQLQHALSSPTFQILTEAVRLDTLLPTCDLAVSYGGHGFVTALLAQGVPLLILPTQIEQFLLAQRVQTLKAGLLVNPEQATPDLDAMLHALLTDARFKAAAQGMAQRISPFDPKAQLAHIENTILQACGAATDLDDHGIAKC